MPKAIVQPAVISVFLLACSLTLPRLVPDESGFASATSAALVFILCFLLSILLALLVFFRTIRQISVLAAQTVMLGFTPTVLLFVAAAWLLAQR